MESVGRDSSMRTNKQINADRILGSRLDQGQTLILEVLLDIRGLLVGKPEEVPLQDKEVNSFKCYLCGTLTPLPKAVALPVGWFTLCCAGCIWMDQAGSNVFVVE